jgi:3-oxoacyl-[acyl-carrier protein] reductase
MQINGKIALVLGGARGIGRELGFALARAGATVILTYYDWPEEAAAMQKDLTALDSRHLAVKIDLREAAQVKRLLGQIEERYQGLHILINNIERGGMPIVHGSYDLPLNSGQWDLEMTTTLKAKWLVFHHALPLLKRAAEGVVVTLSSVAGIVGRSGPAGLIFSDGYAAANRAVSSLTETWAREAAPTVRVNELMLGLFPSRHAGGTRGWDELSSGQREALSRHILLERSGRLDEIVKTVFFLIEGATYMTGSVIRLDGGFVLGAERVPPVPAGSLTESDRAED